MKVEGGADVPGDCQSRILAPGDRTVLVFREELDGLAPPARTFPGAAGLFTICVTYTDVSYGKTFRGRFTFDEKRPVPTILGATIEDLNAP